jgi:hypothetical protein
VCDSKKETLTNTNTKPGASVPKPPPLRTIQPGIIHMTLEIRKQFHDAWRGVEESVPPPFGEAGTPADNGNPAVADCNCNPTGSQSSPQLGLTPTSNPLNAAQTHKH